MVQRVKKYQTRKWSDDCWARFFSWFREYDLQRKQGMKGEPDGKGGDEAAAKDEGHDRYDRTNPKGKMDANNSWWVSELLVGDCQKSVAQPRMGRHYATVVQLAL